jgi:FYVE/RhoGEF/PH domain-containing protein 5/6
MSVSPPPVRVTPAQDIEASSSPKPAASAISMLLAAEQITGQKMTGYRTRIVDELIKKSRRSVYANDELLKGDANEDLKKRCLTITEIIESEKAFLKNMSSAVEHYLNPSKNGESPVPENKAKLLFNNLDQIIEVSTDLLQTMFDKIPDGFDSFALVGNIFVQFVPRFNVFDEYAKSHYQAIKTFGILERKKEVVQYWKELRERTGVLDIMALLIMPVQRFLRHKLLLEELLKRTPESHPDHGDVVKAIGAIDQFAHSVNENVKRHTALQKYNEIERKFGFPKELELPEGSEDIRIFIKEGTLMKVCRKEPKPRYFVLFEDLLVYGESGVLSYSIHRCLDLAKTSVKDVEDSSVMENAFEIYSTGKSFVVFADNVGEKKSWLNSFKQVKLLAANDSQAAIWINDKMSKCCLKCGREFKAHFRRHHCRACGLLVCAKCSPKSAVVPSVSSSKVRVCNGCFDDISNGITPKKASAHVPDNDLSSEDDDSSSEDDAQKLSRSQTSPALNASGGSNKSNSASPDVSRLQAKSPETHKRSTTTIPASNNSSNDSATKKKNTFANLFTTLRGVTSKKKEGDQ